MGLLGDHVDIMKPKAVSIRRKVRATQIIPTKGEVEVKAKNAADPGTKTAPVNPFRRSLKRQREGDESEDLQETLKESNFKVVEIEVNIPQLLSETDKVNEAKISAPEITSLLPSMPIDWCLKSKVRFSSSKQLPWSGMLKTTEEANGTTGFVRVLHKQKDASAQAKIHQSCMYWQHPSLPWVPLFPRQGNKRFEGSQLVDGRFHEALQQDFRQSFKSLYQLLKARQCAFFYLCGPEFTVLFRAAGVCAFTEIHALISPTTKGFRSSLKEKGIDFQMPFRRDDRPDSEEQESPDDTKDDEDFFESLGLAQDGFPAIVAHKVRKAFDTDSGQASCVVVLGNGAQALFNHLLNTDLSIGVGSQAGIPPTLLSPVAFHGASLRSQKIRQTWFRDPETQIRHHAIEIVGPIMPNAVDSLCELLSQSQEDFTLLATPTPGCTAFSRTMNQSHDTTAPVVFAVEALRECGLPKGFIQRICSNGDDHGTVIEADFKTNGYHINTSA
ncbi:protein downstream neighbor of son homolog [Galendromus occidentalis]|uniref:Protein downstream neighbor of son homolog n=1 Tax=Galendromus occidentalis TaxID=34638 RepID=A0AAJ7WJC8_9ACAR|nr:protein downstream neighbor of son homolog [Galendromus occidentalis]